MVQDNGKRESPKAWSAKRETHSETVVFKVTRSVTADERILENDRSTV